jgi:hypothetical protein
MTPPISTRATPPGHPERRRAKSCVARRSRGTRLIFIAEGDSSILNSPFLIHNCLFPYPADPATLPKTHLKKQTQSTDPSCPQEPHLKKQTQFSPSAPQEGPLKKQTQSSTRDATRKNKPNFTHCPNTHNISDSQLFRRA